MQQTQPTSNEEIQEALEANFKDSQITVSGDGYNYQVSVVSDEFEGLFKVKRHQKVYAVLKDFINSGALHALTINTYTPDEKPAEAPVEVPGEASADSTSEK